MDRCVGKPQSLATDSISLNRAAII